MAGFQFENALARLNAAVQGRLTNADAVLDNKVVRIAFDNGYATELGSVGVRQPRAGVLLHLAPRVAAGSRLRVVGGQQYEVVSVEPDGAGWVELVLQAA